MFKRLKETILEIIQQADLILLGLCCAASVFGIAMIYSATRYNNDNRKIIVQTAALLIGIVVLAVGGFGYYIKIYKPKHELDDAEDWDDISFAGPEDEPVEEDFSELTAEEEAERRRRYEEDADEDEDMDGDSDAPVQ